MSPAIESCIKAALATSTTFFLVVALFTAGPAIETRWLPVVGKLDILRVDAMPDGQSEIYVRFDKLRNCKYLGMAWYRGDRTKPSFERVEFDTLLPKGERPNPTRPIGEQVAGPWRIAMPPDELRGNSFVELRHECHQLWETRTEFYP